MHSSPYPATDLFKGPRVARVWTTGAQLEAAAAFATDRVLPYALEERDAGVISITDGTRSAAFDHRGRRIV